MVFLQVLSLAVALYSQDIESQVKKAREHYDEEKYDSAAMLFEAPLPLAKKKCGGTDTSYYAKQVNFISISIYNPSITIFL
jgi:hypothetical protein